MNILNTLLNLIFPIKCLSCGEANSDFCLKCLNNSREPERESESWIFPLYDYRHPPIKKAIWLLKYKHNRRLAEIFAQIMYGRILEELSDLSLMENFRNAILIPIPLANKRIRERGFNQAEILAQKLIEIDKGESFILEANILIKPRETDHQSHKKQRKERLKNILGSFSINPKNEHKIKNKNIILIDDVTTTGATLKEAKKILKQAGAKKVIAFTIAH